MRRRNTDPGTIIDINFGIVYSEPELPVKLNRLAYFDDGLGKLTPECGGSPLKPCFYCNRQKDRHMAVLTGPQKDKIVLICVALGIVILAFAFSTDGNFAK